MDDVHYLYVLFYYPKYDHRTPLARTPLASPGLAELAAFSPRPHLPSSLPASGRLPLASSAIHHLARLRHDRRTLLEVCRPRPPRRRSGCACRTANECT
ncbi:hypothetical protein PAXRUDRAFT_658283 [Paxillus rubicundulus Ve08.2h10]|uniref:Uncharacterized protein n=1 Tax=Paxillus rubicundulus Ve08.2h10 TaxID=930991 RepID=A0A0D0DSA3_9AGAM|nr:hypothetical protein PAXRUDRAFT_658283 [Paxillus rubicundulus Ve08.2h10]